MLTTAGPGPLTMEAGLAGSSAQVTVRGDLDAAAAPALAEMLQFVLGKRPRDVVLQMSEVAFLDCACAGVIAEAARSLPGPGRLAVRDPSPAVRKLLRITGLDAAIPADGAWCPEAASPPRSAQPPACAGTQAGRPETAGAAAAGD